ncbi:MAG: rRNA maturation RNase YbeY [Prevotellaceae bacterium]|jgi:rRNA maturation RNase YbeY|nr:rRNA maturation RNase YbeY [Prevotellaceae bacterium]
MIGYYSEDIKFPNIKRREYSRWIKETAKGYGKKTGEVAFIFCSDARILQINNEYLQHNYYTDIITFDYSEKDTISGDIFISLDTVRSNAGKFEQTYENELNRVIIHGILHLCGQQDKTPEERAEMTRKENLALRLIMN